MYIVLIFFNGDFSMKTGCFFEWSSLCDYLELWGLLQHMVDVFFHDVSIFRCSECVRASFRVIYIV